ncbi:MAG: hypothetical protein WCB93_03870 [Gallionella sp.]
MFNLFFVIKEWKLSIGEKFSDFSGKITAMSTLQSWKLPDHVATAIGMPLAISMLFSAQSKARDGMEVEFCRLYSGSYPGHSQEFAAKAA